MYIYMYIYIHICMFIYIYIYIYVYMQIDLYVYIHIYIYVHAKKFTRTHSYSHIHANTYVYIRKHIYAHTHQAKVKYKAMKGKDESAVCARYDNIASDLANQVHTSEETCGYEKDTYTCEKRERYYIFTRYDNIGAIWRIRYIPQKRRMRMKKTPMHVERERKRDNSVRPL